jgi:hypothetical protein
MDFYEDLATTVTDLLTEFGQTVTLRKVVQGTYVNGVVTSANIDTYPKGAIFDYPLHRYGEMLQNGTLITGATRWLILAVTGGKPELNDHIIQASGNEWVIANIKTINPSGVDVVYDCTIQQ